MKTKSLKFIIASVFLAILLISFTSAALSASPSTVTFNGNGSKTLTITSNESSISFDPSFVLNGVTFSVSGNYTLDSANQTILTITPSENLNEFDFKEKHTSSFNVNAGSDSITINVEVTNEQFCEYSELGYLDIKISDYKIVTGYGDDDQWFPLDEVEIEVEIENNGNEDLEDVIIEWGLYDTENEKWLIEVDDEDKYDIDEDDNEVLTFTFTLDDDLDEDLEDLKDGTLRLYVRATGEVSNGVDEGEKTCDSDSENFDLIIENDFVILTDLEMPETLSCSAPLQLTGKVWNIGDDNQDDVEVKVVIADLDIKEYVKIGDIDSFDKESFSLNLELPEDAKSGSHIIKFSVLDEDGDIYEADNDDESSSFSRTFSLTGDCDLAEVGISAVLQSGGKSGEELVVKATLVNPGVKSQTYLLNVAGYTEWAESATISQSSVQIDAGQSKEVLITMNVKDKMEGDKVFALEVMSGNKLIASQPVSVPITKRSGLNITGFAINNDNWQIWGIGLLNLILVVLIIVIAVRIAKRK